MGAMLTEYIEEKELISIIKEKHKWEKISQLNCPLPPYSFLIFSLPPNTMAEVCTGGCRNSEIMYPCLEEGEKTKERKNGHGKHKKG